MEIQSSGFCLNDKRKKIKVTNDTFFAYKLLESCLMNE